jgi:ribosomal protein S18 acetylase RimI-like enzyme
MIQIRPYTLNDWEGICQVHDRSRPIELEESIKERSFTPLNEDPESSAFLQCRILVDYLGWLYLDPAYIGRGIARQLLKECLKYTGPHAWTVTLAENKRALKLYQNEGFKVKTSFLSDEEGHVCEAYKLTRD